MRPVFLMAIGALLLSSLGSAASAQTTPPPATAKPAAAAPKPATPKAAAPAAAPAAAGVPQTRIAFVNTEAFGDEKVGIARYVAALKGVEREFQPRQSELSAMQTRINSLNEEVTRLNAERAAQTAIQAKVDESQRMQLELKRMSEDAQAAFDRRTDEVMKPIIQDIGKALDQFAAQRSVTVMLDISKIASAVLALNPAADLTMAFIADYNKKNP